MAKSVRSAAKIRSYSRERNDSGYESNEETENYLEQIVTNHQQEQQFHVYPVLRGSRPTPIDHSNSPVSRLAQRSASMFTPKPRSQSSASQTLKPIIHRRSTIFDSTIGRLIGITGTPKIHNEDETYVSTTFRNENTSKFVIGTLWNTFALVNNLFLQRPRKRRNALSGESVLRPDQLAHLRQLYSLAERDQSSTTNLQSIINENLLDSSSTDNLYSIILDILESNKANRCNCYGTHHISSCIYYDHSLPYVTNNTSQIENILSDIQKLNKIKYQDAATQSFVEKPQRTFTHFKPTQLLSHVSTQYSPIGDKNIDVSTQTMENNLNNISIQHKPEEKPKSMNISTQIIEDNNIHNRKTSLINQLKQVISSSTPKEPLKIEQKLDKKPPSHTVRSLVSMFETTNQINFPSQHKSITNNSKVLTPPNAPLLNISTEQTHSPIVHDTIEQYANEIASTIVDNAVLTATTTTLYYNEQQHRRFSLYNNGGGHGKGLLFRSNTFVPSIQTEDNRRGILK